MENVISRLRKAAKETPVKAYVWEKTPVAFPSCRVFQGVGCKIVFGQWSKSPPYWRPTATVLRKP